MIKFIGEITKEIQETYKFRYVIKNFVSSTLKLRYQKTVLGFLWSLLGPMFHYMVMGYIFSYTMRGSIPNYAGFVFAGALFYNVISGVILKSPSIFLANEHFIKKIYIPKLVFVLDSVLVELVNFMLGFLALFILGLIFGRVQITEHIIVVPFVIIAAAFLSVGLGAIFAVCGVYFRDLIMIIPVVMQALFFMTPIIYNVEFLPPKFQYLVKLNPLMYIIESFRKPIINNIWPDARDLQVTFFSAIVVFLFGIWFMKKFENKIVFRL